MKKVLISGISGMVGSHLAEYLVENNLAEVHGIIRRDSANGIDNLKAVFPKIKVHWGDLKDLVALKKILEEVKPNYIFHLAAQSLVPYSFDNPADTLDNNVIGTSNLLEAIRMTKQDPIFMMCSSSEVYGDVRKEDLPIKESQEFRPSSPYAVSKVACDRLSWMHWKCYNRKVVITRMFTHAGARRGTMFHESAFGKQIVEIEKGLRKPVVEVGNIDSVRTYLHVKDAVEAYWKLVEAAEKNPLLFGEAYNVGGMETMTVRKFLDKMIINSESKKEIKVVVSKKLLRPADVTQQIPCIDKFTKATGWKPARNVTDIINDVLDYWRERC